MQAFTVQALGYLASALVFAAFYMRTMLPLRRIAIASNVTFLAYGIVLGLWPVVILHALLLPLNIVRLLQARRLLANIAAARQDDNLPIQTMIAALHPQREASGTVLFNKGDQADGAYYIADGEVRFPEINVTVGPGQLFGEMALLASDRKRTGSAICVTDVRLYHVNEESFLKAFHQDPPLAFALTHLISKRLLANLDRMQALRETECQTGLPGYQPSP